jgi:hypothetical protein
MLLALLLALLLLLVSLVVVVDTHDSRQCLRRGSPSLQGCRLVELTLQLLLLLALLLALLPLELQPVHRCAHRSCSCRRRQGPSAVTRTLCAKPAAGGT